jgi:hypothetical protein
MPIEYKKKQVLFQDIVSVEEAEELLGWLQKKPSSKVNLAACTHVHPANLQVLMAAGTRIAAWPKDEDLHAWLETALKQE